MRFSIDCVARDWAPVTPSMSGSMTSCILSLPSGMIAFEKRSFAARRMASSRGMIGGGDGGTAGAGAAGAGVGAAGGVCATARDTKAPVRSVATARRVGFMEPSSQSMTDRADHAPKALRNKNPKGRSRGGV